MSDRVLNPQMVVLMTEISPGSLIRLISITHNLENDPFQHIPDYIGRFSETYEPNSIKVDDPDKRKWVSGLSLKITNGLIGKNTGLTLMRPIKMRPSRSMVVLKQPYITMRKRTKK